MERKICQLQKKKFGGFVTEALENKKALTSFETSA